VVKNLQRSTRQLEQVARRLDVRLPNLVSSEGAAEITRRKLGLARNAALGTLEARKPSFLESRPPIDIIAQGSMGRGEMSEVESDFDYILVAYENVTDPSDIVVAREAAQDAEVAVTKKTHGSTTGFGGLASAIDLVNTIGLDADTNVHTTRRVLLLWESIALVDEDRFEDLLRTVLHRYLYEYEESPEGGDRSKAGVPRFLLNDIVRFWRTLAVDYQAKRWLQPTADKGGMRYLKLRSTRKLNFIGALIPLMLPAIEGKKVTVDDLADNYGLTALARISLLEEYLEDEAARLALKRVLELADNFSYLFGQKSFRDAAATVSDPRDPNSDPAFRDARNKTQELQEQLEQLFLSEVSLRRVADASPATRPNMRYLTGRYLLF
jgi:hypothetical protein